MPWYIYICDCGYEADYKHSIFESPTLRCKNCENILSRKPQVAGVSFKGSGFYRTDK